MSEYDINKPCWTWASADGAVGAGNTVHVGHAGGGGAAGRSSSINVRVSRDVRTGEVLTCDTVTSEVRPYPGKRYDSPLLNERETTHGDWNKTAETAQRLKTVLADARRLPHAQQEALDMICTKLARIVCGNASEPDHWKDLAGYATLVVENLPS